MADMTCKLIEKLLEMSGFFRWSNTRQSEQYFSLERASQTVLEGHASGIFSIKSFIPSIVVHFFFLMHTLCLFSISLTDKRC